MYGYPSSLTVGGQFSSYPKSCYGPDCRPTVRATAREVPTGLQDVTLVEQRSVSMHARSASSSELRPHSPAVSLNRRGLGRMSSRILDFEGPGYTGAVEGGYTSLALRLYRGLAGKTLHGAFPKCEEGVTDRVRAV